jgi:hypothetical protein
VSTVGVTAKKRFTLFQIVEEDIDRDGSYGASEGDRTCGLIVECDRIAALGGERGSVALSGRADAYGRMSSSIIGRRFGNDGIRGGRVDASSNRR